VSDENLGYIRQNHGLNEDNDEEQYHRRYVDAAKVGQHITNRTQYRFGQPVEEFGKHVYDLIARVYDVECDQPAQYRHSDDDPHVNGEHVRDELQKLEHSLAPKWRAACAGLMGFPTTNKSGVSFDRAAGAILDTMAARP
jgi:hypothetical protein